MATGAIQQVTFRVNADNRGGRVSAQAGSHTDARAESYNVNPGADQYKGIVRRLHAADGAGSKRITATLETGSEFIRYMKGECAGLAFSSKGMIGLEDESAVGMVVVQDRIQMGIRTDRAMRVQLTASVVADLDVVVISFSGPAFKSAIKIYDSYSETLELTTPGEYSLAGAFQLAVKLPNLSLGGRPLSVQMDARLTPA